MIKLKYSKYEDYKTELVLRDNIADLVPYKVSMPTPPPMEEFVNFGLPAEEQFFVYQEIPQWVWRFDKQIAVSFEERERLGAIINNTKEYTNFIADQWEKRTNGIFIMINGKPLYIPGNYWWILNYYNGESGQAEFRGSDLEYQYWWNFCIVNNPRSFGGIELTMRRDGKSFRAGGNHLEAITRTRKAKGGIQSKTEGDAREFFKTNIISPSLRVPFYFRPYSDGRAYAKAELEYKMPHDPRKGFESQTKPAASTETAFDGQKLFRYIYDEAGKPQDMICWITWNVHKKCLLIRHEIVGKGIVTTTVEEASKGGMREFQKLWNMSDQGKIQRNNETESGLCQYFKPSYEGYRMDQYGFSVIDTPTEAQREFFTKNGYPDPDLGGKDLIDIMIDSQKDSSLKQQTIRQFPRTIREAFRVANNECHFDIIKINNQLDKYLYKDNSVIGGQADVIKGNLYWVNGEKDGEVYFREEKIGYWLFDRELFKILNERRNQFKINPKNNLKAPLNKNLGCIGADPFKYDVTQGKRKSLGTASGYINYDLEIENTYKEKNPDGEMITENLFFEYGGRRATVKEYIDDLIKTCIFLGMPLFPETNIYELVSDFKSRGMENYLLYRYVEKLNEKKVLVRQLAANPGLQTSGEVIITDLFDYVAEYVESHAHRCKFVNTLEDFREVERGNLKDYDYFVSGSYAIYGAKKGQKPVIKRMIEQMPQGYSNPFKYSRANN